MSEGMEMFKLLVTLLLVCAVRGEAVLTFPPLIKQKPTVHYPSIASHGNYSVIVWQKGSFEHTVCAAIKTPEGFATFDLATAPSCSYPTVFLDKDLTATIVWVAEDETLSLNSVRLKPDHTQSELMSCPLESHLFIDVVGDESGNIVAAWSSNSWVKATSLSSNASNWSPTQTLSCQGSSQAPALSIRKDQAAAIWNTTYELHGSLLSFKTNKWTSIEKPIKNELEITHCSAALDPVGNLNVVFAHKDSYGSQNISLATLKRNSKQWSKTLLSEDAQAQLPFIGIDHKGDAFVVWSESTGDETLKVSCALINQDKQISRSIQYLPKNRVLNFKPIQIRFEKDGGIDIWGSSLLNSSTEQGYIYLQGE